MEYLNMMDDGIELSNERATHEDLNIDSKEFFLKSREKQLDKNPLSDINVRKAIFHAIDRERIVNELYGKYNQVLNSLFPADSYFYSQSWAEYSYDVEKAKEYLKKAGYGTDNPLYVTIGSTSDSDTKQVIEEMIKEDLSEIGIEIWILNNPSKEWYSDYVSKGDYELGLWSIYNFDESDLINGFSSDKIPSMETEENKNCYNFYWYKNTDVDSLLKTIKNEVNIEKKKELISNLQNIIASDAVILPLYSRIDVVAYNNKKIDSIDIKTINNKIHFDIENWVLNSDWQTNENEVKEIIVGLNSEDYSLGSLFSRDFISNLVIRGLWEINEKGEYEKVLVEEAFIKEKSINGSADAGMEVRVILKDGIFWEDGSNITAEDVKYTYDTIKKNENILNIDKDYLKIDKIEVINEKEFNIVFKEKIKNWEKFFGIVFPEDSMEEKDIINLKIEDIVANGPYKVEEYKNQDYLLLKKNDFYFNEIPNVDYFRILFDTNFANLVNMLRNGEIDLLKVLFDLELVNELDDNKDIDLFIKPGNYMEHLAVCLKPKEE
ncbi:MAG: ABC transporter substrate-binding protein [Actinomycetota bacterium]|nr:ABC transporter substrate-binding protein [Actinomycetota bacterium]